MKKLFTLILVFVGFLSFAQTRYSAKDFFTEKNIVWYGIDYSKAKFIGSFAQFKDAGTVDGKALVDKYFPGWNAVIPHEPQKYDVAKFLNKTTSYNDLAPVTSVNGETNPDGIMQENDYTLSEGDIPAMIKKYKVGDKTEGLGAVFITEAYNHSKETASYYVVIFDIASKQVLISEKYSAKPGGFGIKNYWISTALKTFQQVSDNYGKWKKTYGG
ncbi:MAG TPA: hypothetical protein VL443_25810 [Cyclobacteriaceae bacterium]|jgi:hypothetical protein|nr:hypothetical protein [Cyclobacteriaceae bacterium]